MAIVMAGVLVPAPAVAHPGTAAVLRHGVDDLHGLGITGVQGLVRDGGRAVAASSGAAPVDGYFRIGSVTKTFVAVALLQLAGEGRIGLDDPVDRWLPGVVDGNGNDGRRVTVRHLLQQTSGLYDPTFDLTVWQSADGFAAHRFDHYAEKDLVATAMRHAPLFPAGTRWSYSNTNYLVAGMLLERVTGRPWQAAVRSRILAPLRLTHTFYPGDRVSLPRPHAEASKQFAPGGPLVGTTEFNPTVTGAAGGLVSTPADLAGFWQALERGRLLPPGQLAELHRTVPADDFQALRPGIRYGLGVMWIPNRCGGAWAHLGSMPGMSTLAAAGPGGRRSTVLYLATELADPDRDRAVVQRQLTLLDDLICQSR
ncbi:D-alanyl-D-alanine carboxypeptidase [Actinoplanes octamycinicus]|uniref:D-alanyl-D-alanine carboxypeptidase n=1 Tax=Actinoplanes octamycinicus TaxID=135948 RepID=A0A7W7MCI0_9ACTN|nr:serine hydrolase domain-containing protein [Actinoplanes octamycinicus]MBB4745141.1 D-alanyl-D-alanine carboxypeptidase [Actinoplanes octamycinicus]GIE62732.1 serine hydrolase [Actinoplanes octamycinicus]